MQRSRLKKQPPLHAPSCPGSAVADCVYLAITWKLSAPQVTGKPLTARRIPRPVPLHRLPPIASAAPDLGKLRDAVYDVLPRQADIRAEN
jgi:hypothetical protein